MGLGHTAVPDKMVKVSQQGSDLWVITKLPASDHGADKA